MTDLDSQWFRSNPGRAFRLRRQTPAEVAAWPVPIVPSMTAWCIVRAEDGATEAFGFPADGAPDDHDDELAPIFDAVRDRAA